MWRFGRQEKILINQSPISERNFLFQTGYIYLLKRERDAMGACGSSMTPEEREAKRRSRALERRMSLDNNVEEEKIKLLLLGAGESGKSTIFKQMRIMYGDKMGEKELKTFVSIVRSNCLSSMVLAVNSAPDIAAVVEDDVSADKIKGLDYTSEYTPEIASAIKNLWADPGIKKVFENKAKFQLNDSAEYWFENLDRISAPDYVPSQQDVLRTRVRTSGIVENSYTIDGVPFVMYDVGGQRNERKKWIHCFDAVTAIIFVASISEYNQVLFEDHNTNRFVEALDLFEEIVNSKYFVETSMILFLNKRDLFAKKIAKTPIESCGGFFSDCTAGNNYDNGVEYLKNKFLDRNRNPLKEIYPHVTCATDTNNVAAVFNACKDIILKQNLKDSGLL
jgi:GTPase SAR1 family protein